MGSPHMEHRPLTHQHLYFAFDPYEKVFGSVFDILPQ